MSDLVFEIRVCESCGLRYPLQKGHSFGERCPHCLGGTQVVLEKVIEAEERTRSAALPKTTFTRAVLLDNIRSAWNVGSIFRSADGFGFNHVYLCGITPSPDHEAVSKTSLGAEETVPWSMHKDAVRLAQGLKKEGWKIYALEEAEHTSDIRAYDEGGQNTVLILGSEVTGVDPELLNLCDAVFHIPMRGEKRSFNVAIAFSIAAFAMENS